MALLFREFIHSNGRSHPRSGVELVVLATIVLLALRQVDTSPTEADLLTDSPATLWCPDVCDCYNNMETLDCSQRRLSVVPARLPQSARRVYLEDNNIGHIDFEEFRQSRRVSELVLDRNRLTSVNTGTFCMMTSLQELSLSANMIRSFDVTGKPGCSSVALRQLDLSLNLLTAVPVNLSSFVPRLEILDLSCNEITQATLDNSFIQLTSLRQLDLSRNRIHFMSATDFLPLRHVPLDVLNLAETELAVIEDNALCPLSDSLKYLSLTGNPLDPDNLARALAGYASKSLDGLRSNFTEQNISELSASRISETTQSATLPLTRLSIGEMSVVNLTQNMLAQFHHLLVLDAAFTDLEWVESAVFDHLGRLETLHLEAGRLTVVDNLSAMKNLRRVYLQRNQLTQVVTLTGLYSLVFIDLSYNRISHVPALWLDGFRHLQMVNLSHNEIVEVEPYAFHQVSIFSTLDISFNRLQAIHSYGLVRLMRLDASHNQLIDIDNTAFTGLHLTFQQLNVAFNNLTTFRADVLFHQTNGLHKLDLSHNYLGPFLRAAALRQHYYSTSTERPGSGKGRTRIVELAADWAWPEDSANPLSRLTLLTSLDLSSNQLSHLGCDVMASLRSLSELVVADNLVSDLADVSLQCCGLRLTRLDISRNQLTQLDVPSLSSLTGLQELDARSNPLRCDGDLACIARREFRSWLNDTIDRLTLLRHPDDMVDEYLCHDTDVSYISGPIDCDEVLLPVTSEQLAGGHDSYQHTGIILVSTSAVTVVIVATFIVVLGLVVGRRYWRRSDADYCKRRQSQLLQQDHHHHHQDAHQLDEGETSSRLQALVTTCLRCWWSNHAPMSSVGYRQVIGAELDVTSSADVTAMTSSDPTLLSADSDK